MILPARIYLVHRVLDDLRFLYTKGAVSGDELKRVQRKMASVIKKHTKALYRMREFLLRELAGLRRMTVNDQSPELMEVGAPDTYATLKAHMERRIRDVKELEKLSEISVVKEKDKSKEKKKKKKA